MKTTISFRQPLFTGNTKEIAKNHKFTNPYKYSYQSQEKSDASNPWLQFELRNYNQDLGRWFAPDPYGQFASPYIAMGNNPVSGVDPDGGWVNASAGGANWAGKRELDAQRANHSGAFDYAHVQARYDNEYENIRQNCLLGNNGGDIAGFLNQVQALNSRYYGLNQYGSQNFTARTGVEYLTANEMGLNSSQVLGVNQSIHVSEFAQRSRQDMAESANKTNSEAMSAHETLENQVAKDAAVYKVNTDIYALMSKVNGEPGKRDGTKFSEHYSDGTTINFYYNANGKLTDVFEYHANGSYANQGTYGKHTSYGGGVTGDGSGLNNMNEPPVNSGLDLMDKLSNVSSYGVALWSLGEVAGKKADKIAKGMADAIGFTLSSVHRGLSGTAKVLASMGKKVTYVDFAVNLMKFGTGKQGGGETFLNISVSVIAMRIGGVPGIAVGLAIPVIKAIIDSDGGGKYTGVPCGGIGCRK